MVRATLATETAQCYQNIHLDHGNEITVCQKVVQKKVYTIIFFLFTVQFYSIMAYYCFSPVCRSQQWKQEVSQQQQANRQEQEVSHGKLSWVMFSMTLVFIAATFTDISLISHWAISLTFRTLFNKLFFTNWSLNAKKKPKWSLGKSLCSSCVLVDEGGEALLLF